MTETPLSIIAEVSRVVTRVVDRITGDRAAYPLLVSEACKLALRNYGIESRVLYGNAEWVEVLEDQTAIWAGCWGDNFHFWLSTEYSEIVDLNMSVACRKKYLVSPLKSRPIYSPPLLWTTEVPKFCQFFPLGIAELDLDAAPDFKYYQAVTSEVVTKCLPSKIQEKEGEFEFPNEPVLCQKRRLLDDSKDTFRFYDRALSVYGIPPRSH